MARVRTQLTSLKPHPALLRASERIGLIGTAAWCAIGLATREPRPITARLPLTLDLLQTLEDAGILARCSSDTPNAQRALYDPISWLNRDHGTPAGALQRALEQALQLRVKDDRSSSEALWSLLVDADSEAYLLHLLQRHQMANLDPNPLIASIRREWAPYSLGRRRYLAWAGLRHAAACLLRENFDATAAYSMLETQIQRRGRWLFAKQAANEIAEDDYCFVPDSNWRHPLLLEIFLERVMPMGRLFWSKPPPPKPRHG
ncbi:hypothetical protein [Pseudoxanthomonas sp.]|uniref:hypothetical protein n=1 Tax=Pseudoxanthomonas sp. TaxID=1871049 RepID=UPI0026058743|nr:hypothetical protein [Pseudoxanthomonas sp.]WDS36921.1 MAG: hypothetical protein O8I58_03150 [Pseudoxanthomonas sp.]